MLRPPPSPRGSVPRGAAPTPLEPLTASPLRGGCTNGPAPQFQPRRGALISAAMLVSVPIGSRRAPEA
ncbi:hypothetical protein NDU88_008109 [Pleurodeles waltl]|uniref:Uncharacterized protein n=1 Tax=Pleurodeles waltl TaxID=8319 RepID=A0AAV7RSU5_PLEWA|nr:hypothetical protein NDU88_008109 [Pleurodeles waltl]